LVAAPAKRQLDVNVTICNDSSLTLFCDGSHQRSNRLGAYEAAIQDGGNDQRI
jgi:CDGSH-type Zn-finger protein